MLREIFCFSVSMSVILASTVSPMVRHFFRLADAVVSDLRDMDQAVHAGQHLPQKRQRA